MVVSVSTLHANFDVDYVIVYRFTETSMLSCTSVGFLLILTHR